MFSKNTSLVLLVATFMSLPSASYAIERIREPREKMEWNKTESQSTASPEIRRFEGDIHCRDHKRDSAGDHSKCELQLTTNDGETYELHASEELSRLVCEKHDRHLKVELNAEKESSFLFWGGHLKVVDFKVLGEMPESVCQGFEEGEVLQDSVGQSGKRPYKSRLLRRSHRHGT